MIALDHQSASLEVADRGQLVGAVAAKLRTGSRHAFKQLPRRRIVQPAEVHRVVSRVHPGADRDVLADGGDVMEVGLDIVVRAGWNDIVEVGRCAGGEDAVSG